MIAASQPSHPPPSNHQHLHPAVSDGNLDAADPRLAIRGWDGGGGGGVLGWRSVYGAAIRWTGLLTAAASLAQRDRDK